MSWARGQRERWSYWKSGRQLMLLRQLYERNAVAQQRVLEFRKTKSESIKTVHDRDLHSYRMSFPYFGFIEVSIDAVPPFLMFSNNDDLVAQSYFWYGKDGYESVAVQIWCDLVKRSEIIFDIGAYTGLYCIVARLLNKNAHVVAFEPVKKVFGRLITNLQVNGLGQSILAENIAVSDSQGTIEMKHYRGPLVLGSGSSLVAKPGKKVVSMEICDAVTLDSYVSSHKINKVDLIKIDVEQAELLAIKGMIKILERHKPDLIVEVSSQESVNGIRGLVDHIGYSYFVIDERRKELVPLEHVAVRKVENFLLTVQ